MLLPRMVFGLGAPRSGTFSLFRLLQAQNNTYAFHEGGFLPWVPDLTEMWRLIYRFQGTALNKKYNTRIIAPVSFFWITYISELMGMLVNPRFICLKRDRAEFVESAYNHFSKINNWTYPDSKYWEKDEVDDEFTDLFPKYDFPKREAMAEYYDDYYSRAEFWQGNNPDVFKIFPIDALNSESGVRSILDFAEISNPVIHVGVKLNTKDKPRGKIDVQS